MKQDPGRLFDDPVVSQTLRDDLRTMDAEPGPRYDLDAEVQRFLTLIASGGAVAPSTPPSSSSSSAPSAATTPAATMSPAAGPGTAKVLPLGVKVVGLVMLGLVGWAVALKVLSRNTAERSPQHSLQSWRADSASR